MAVFKSEINHLQKYGRPILGDKYFGTKEFAYGYYLKNLVENNEEKKYKPKFFSHSDIEILSFEFKKIEDFKFFNFGAEHPVFYENFIKDEELFQDLKSFSRNIVI